MGRVAERLSGLKVIGLATPVFFYLIEVPSQAGYSKADPNTSLKIIVEPVEVMQRSLFGLF